MPLYEAVFVDTGQIRRTSQGVFRPTDYRDADMFGTLGGGIRIVAAIMLYLERKTDTFVFMTGTTQKSVEMYGPDTPSEAAVLAAKLRRSLEGLKRRSDYGPRFANLVPPTIIEDGSGSNTLTNIEGAFRMIVARGWTQVAYLSNNYHIPRIKALIEWMLKDKEAPDVHADYLLAEDIVRETLPGKYDDVIERAYASAEMAARIKSETQGLADIRDGKYARREFQLVLREREQQGT